MIIIVTFMVCFGFVFHVVYVLGFLCFFMSIFGPSCFLSSFSVIISSLDFSCVLLII